MAPRDHQCLRHETTLRQRSRRWEYFPADKIVLWSSFDWNGARRGRVAFWMVRWVVRCVGAELFPYGAIVCRLRKASLSSEWNPKGYQTNTKSVTSGGFQRSRVLAKFCVDFQPETSSAHSLCTQVSLPQSSGCGWGVVKLLKTHTPKTVTLIGKH